MIMGNIANEVVLVFDPFKEFGIDEDVRLVIHDGVGKKFSHLIVLEPKRDI